MADLANIPPGQLPAILRAIRLLARDPSGASIKKLQASGSAWRLRIGSWRVFFEFNQNEHLVKVLKVSDRKDAY